MLKQEKIKFSNAIATLHENLEKNYCHFIIIKPEITFFWTRFFYDYYILYALLANGHHNALLIRINELRRIRNAHITYQILL